jgi:NTE family protein
VPRLTRGAWGVRPWSRVADPPTLDIAVARRAFPDRSSYQGVGALVDIFRVREYFGALTNARDVARKIREDATFLAQLRRATVKLPFDSPSRPLEKPLWPRRASHVRLVQTRLGIVATGGSGALASLIGVVQACRELGLEPQVMSFASGAALFGFPMSAGKSPAEVADFVLSLDSTDWIDVNWRGLAGILPAQGRGFAGVIKGDKLEATYARFLGDMTLGELAIPAYAPVWNIEHNRLEYIGPRTHPRLTVAKAIRMSVSLPLFLEPTRWRGGSWCDGAIVDIFPVRPILDLEPRCDAVLGVNCFYPPEFEGEDASGWQSRTWSVLDIGDQVVTAQHIEIARGNVRRLRAEVEQVMMIDPVPYELVRRAGLYAQFIDRSGWPDFIRSGHRAAGDALKKGLRLAPANGTVKRSA